MTYIEPDQPAEETPPPSQPDIEPGATPEELPPLEPGGGDPGDSRPFEGG